MQNIENIQRFNKRLVRVTRKMTEDCKKLLRLLGLPVVEAPSEAEAQCAQLCKEGLVYAAATEDMDTLTFGCPRLVRNLTSANNEKVKELQIEKILNGLELTQDQFIDLSILMGCDYCANIRGIGGKKGLDLIRKFNTIEAILTEKFGITDFVEVEIEYDIRGKKDEVKEEIAADDEIKEDDENVDQSVDSEKKAEEKEENENQNGSDAEQEELKDDDEEYKAEEEDNEEEEEDESPAQKAKKPKRKAISVPENWPFKGARQLFKEPLVNKNEYTDADLKMKDIDEDGLVEFLCGENGFSEDRVRAAIKRAKLSKAKSSQTRIDAFFKVMPSSSSSAPSNGPNSKNAAQKRNGSSGKGKGGAPSKRGRR